jgi:ribosomal protein S18 acetylase RimI-like enzyme
MEVREIKISDYQAVHSLWQNCHGIGLHRHEDSEYGLGVYLARNSGLSFVAACNGKIIGAILCGHDGRRGLLHHLAVSNEHRRSGIGRALIESALEQLRIKGIRRCNGFVFENNQDALEFWRRVGWTQRNDLKVVSKEIII